MDELESLHKKIAELQQKADELYKQKKETAAAQAKALIKEFNLTAKDVGIHVDVPQQSEAKYRFGNQVWTGKGRRPQWVLDHESKGGNREDFRVDKA